MKIILAAMILIVAALAVAQMHPFPGPGAASGSPLIGIVTSGLVAFWDLSTPYYNAGTKVFTDLSGTGNWICAGSYGGGACQGGASGPVVGATYSDFDAVGKACDMSGDSATLSITGDLTVEAIAYPYSVAAGTHPIVAKGASTSEFRYTFVGAQVRFYRGGGEIWGTNLSINTWYHLSVTVTSAVAQLYLNGAASGSTYEVGVPSDGATVVTLARQATNYFTGRIVRVRIYNRALGSDEITANYNRDKAVLAARGISLP